MQFFYFFPIRFSTAAAAESCYTVPAEGGSEMETVRIGTAVKDREYRK